MYATEKVGKYGGMTSLNAIPATELAIVQHAMLVALHYSATIKQMDGIAAKNAMMLK